MRSLEILLREYCGEGRGQKKKLSPMPHAIKNADYCRTGI